MRRLAMLLGCAVLLAGCGSATVELRPTRTARGLVAAADIGPVPRSLVAFSASNALLVFPRSRILETRDGGRTWRELPTNAPEGDRRFLSLTDWLASHDGRLRESQDGGRTWRLVGTLPRPLQASSFRTRNFGYACARTCVLTTDAGRTLNRIALPRSPRCSFEFDIRLAVAFADATHGLMICGGQPGAGSQLKHAWSWDGRSWHALPEPSGSGYVGDVEPIGKNAYVHHSGRVGDLLTTDGGRTWRLGLLSDAIGGNWTSPSQGWALDARRGNIFRTDDGGRNWLQVAPAFWPSGEEILCDASRGFGAGTSDLSQRPDTQLYATADRGRNWSVVARLRGAGSPRACFGRDVFVTQSRADTTELLHSRDAGRTWRTLRIPGGAILASFLSARTFYALGSRGSVYTTHDGGGRWRRTTVSGGFIVGIAFASVRVGLAIVERRTGVKQMSTTLLRTTDAGKTWQRVPVRVPSLRINEVIGAHGTLWAYGVICKPGAETCAQRLARTTDAGRHWTLVVLNRRAPSNVQFLSATYGVAPGYRGLYVTRDGGVTWRWHRRGNGYS